MDFTQAKAQFLQEIERSDHQFADTLSFIKRWFFYTPSAFNFHGLTNQAEQNQGSCKILALALLIKLTREQALLCFGEHYRALAHTDQSSHLNLRALKEKGLTNLSFRQFPLQLK